MAKIRRAGKTREDEAESGTPSSVDGGSSQRMKTPNTRHLGVNRPAITKRYMTRQSTTFLQIHTPASAPTMKTVRDFSHSQVSVTPIASSRSVSVSGRSWMARRGTITDRSNNSEAAAEEDWSFPTPEEITKFTSAILRDDSPDEVQEVPPPVLPEPVVNNNLPDEYAHEGSNVVGTKGEDCQGSPPRSINVTEMAAMLDGYASDPDEVDSFINPSLVTVHGYRVTKETASLLRDIIAKYGDIAEKCSLQGSAFRSTALEMVCSVVHRLERSRFNEITSTELQSMIVNITDLISLGLDVGWLRDRVEMISKALVLFKGTPGLKAAKSKNKEEMEKKEKAIGLLMEELAAIKAEREKIDEMVVETKSTVKCFLGRSLVEGLL